MCKRYFNDLFSHLLLLNLKMMARLITIIALSFLYSASSSAQAITFSEKLVDAASSRTLVNVRYDGAYVSIPYPNGDVPASTGVCTDVIIRSYRALGIDLQKRVHEDMAAHFDAYPSRRIWGLKKPDTNIDHRRVPNLAVFFERFGQSLPVTSLASDYLPGDIVTWMLNGNLPHIGIVVDTKSAQTGNPLIVHNIGAGPKMDDMLFAAKITGHFRYHPKY